MKTLLIALLTLCLTAAADDMFLEDGRVANVTRNFTWQGNTLENVQLGARDGASVWLKHKGPSAGKGTAATRVPIDQLPDLWQKAFWKRCAEKAAPAGMDAKHLPVLAHLLRSAVDTAPAAVALTGQKANGEAFTAHGIAVDAKRILIVTATGAAWVNNEFFKDPRLLRDEIECTVNPTLHKAVRARVELAAREASAAKGNSTAQAGSDARAAGDKWETTHPKPRKASASVGEAAKDPFAQ